ncbi:MULTISPECIES: HIT domain-containing protein [Acidobacterium]|uniref:HIT domain protein n=1 Tax=Acidobacterium capsulatum (strain ATCC 51196 / DSM 11244 / BCRC 80197 / JCM 7670 / NBRC 15755 / NCIMB 13165 / 161) TaxID=240015 RepID=C1F7P8_ACIC5|nr:MULTISPECIES: HIT domain-containing protein [Acidobacterium]ACO34603.1 HIT domain protein [Acidobacterium capsulatum ATCC 51196]HCT59666.1 HIT domain-containing protein [Acidobacterium sp.]
MDYLWTPWRYAYVTSADKALRPGIAPELDAYYPAGQESRCVFCNLLGSVDAAIAAGMPPDDAEQAALLVARGRHNYLCLNRFPYTAGHVMVVPYVHQASLAALAPEAAEEMMTMAQKVEQVLAGVYHPEGFNFGLNLGKAAGAGVDTHLHFHAMPRWTGDTNFMTVVAETRILPEDLKVTWQRLRTAWAE